MSRVRLYLLEGNRYRHLGIHTQTNACWSIPRSQAVFIHFKIFIRYGESGNYDAFVVVQCLMLDRPAPGTDILFFFRLFSSICRVVHRMKNVFYLIFITIVNTLSQIESSANCECSTCKMELVFILLGF